MSKLFNMKKLTDIAKRKQTISVVLIFVFIAAALTSIFISPQLSQWSIHEGDIALKTTYAPYDFTYYWGVDEKGTEEARKLAYDAVPFYVTRDLVLEEKTKVDLEDFFNVLGEERRQEIPLSDKVVALRTATGDRVPEKNIRILFEQADIAELREKTMKVLDNVFLGGYMDEEGLTYLKDKGRKKVAIYSSETDRGIQRNTADLLNRNTVGAAIEGYASKEFPGDRKTQQVAAALVKAYAVPNLVPDEKRTEAKKQKAIDNVQPVYQSWEVKKNELIIEKGQRVNSGHIAQISQIRRVFKPGTTPNFFLGVLLLFALLLAIAAVYIHFTQKGHFLRNTKMIAIIVICVFFMIIISDFVVRSPQPSYFIPMAAMGMILMLLVNFNVAFLCVVLTSILISVLTGGKIEVPLVLIFGSVVGMATVKGARRRGQILWAGLLVGLANFFSIACVGLVNGMGLDFFTKEGTRGIASGILSGVIVMGVLPVLEHLFKVPTNISLLELSDLNHPLLKEMALEAPGTYHHSILVGNLAEAACDAIGANSLLARVGAYYHDIGKIPKAEYFSENEMGVGSRHANLAPSMSALIIAKHVKEGVEIAKQHKLNNAIIDFIRQHHGDSLTAYFYQKAIEKSEDGKALREEDFRYPGPRPQTKESAIILLADSVEASSRSLDEPTPASIRNLVRKIINNKFIDGQLDECDLTLKDMHKIADSFVRVLMGVFHTRLDYPEPAKKQSNKAPADDDKNKQPKPKQKKKD